MTARGNGSRIVLAALAATLAVVAFAEEPKEVATVSEAELAEANAELAKLRDEIASEKIPMSRELAEREQRLADLRREQENVVRESDAGTLGVASTEAELKLRRDELVYIGNLLDEYARTFDSKLDVTERSRYRESIEAAKLAPAGEGAPPMDRFLKQLAVVGVSVTRLDDLMGGTRFAGSAVDPQGVLTEGRYALIGPVAFFAANDGHTAGIAVAQTGSEHAAVRELDPSLQPGVKEVVAEGTGLLPIDPTRGGALQELVQRASLVHIFKKGGPIMWPLLAVSILALGTVLERVLFLVGEQRRRDAKALADLLAAVQKRDVAGAIQIGDRSRYFVVRALGYALRHDETSLPSALMYANAQELKRFSRGIPVLDTAITISPLLGLLGTVTGMMHSFSLIGGELSAPAAITGGIAEALIATAFGLGIAILALIPFNVLNNRVEVARHELEAAATQLELIVQGSTGSLRVGGLAAATPVAQEA
jgi:biopolymer transport protein ExbB